MGMFANKVANADPSEGTGLFFLEGRYPIVQVEQIKLFTSKDPRKGGCEVFVINCDILESLVETRPAGMRGVSQVLKETQPGAPADVKKFIWSAFPQFTGQALDEQSIKFLASAEQPVRGRLLELECYIKVNDTNPAKKFTKHIWRPLPDSIQAKAGELRAKCGLPPL